MASVTVPPLPRTPHLFGLFSVASVVDVADPHMFMGVQWQPYPCDNPSLWRHDCPPPDKPREKRLTEQPATVTATPINVYGSFDCKLVGYNMPEATARAREHLLLGEQHAVEYGVWTGASDNVPRLADTNTPSLGTVHDAASLLSELYQASDIHLAGDPVLHIPRAAAPHMRLHLMHAQGGRVVTAEGIPVAIGTGYTEANTGPDGSKAPAGAFWVYATGPVTVWRGPVMDVPDPAEQGFNTRTNDYVALAERQFLVGWDCLTLAALFAPARG
ncbi:hypothetical protein [Amycolatopsis sp. DSM 110486]|uniref:hypothetical protein n=1 Tax=Amycolatopsis sp. DSM 110486 TaxID=2865832 RepID=UPI001C694469|nr:hypothetical protein [Amycolatopsis sp. DSM 110486]QYN17602.1 hypothetical protein K1T34_32985 [Amycolatopsis sp. DSM 110486]